MAQMTQQMAQLTQMTQTVERGTKYLIRVRKQDGLARYHANAYVRHIFRHLQRTPMEDFSIVLINTPKYLLFLTSHIRREDAYTMFLTWGSMPDVEVYPIIEDIEQGNPYRRVICLRSFPKRKTARLPKVAGWLGHYRWVAYERAGEVEGLLISEEPPIVPYPADLSSEAYLITASEEEDVIRYTDLTGYSPEYTVPLFYPSV
jgi:hypothetical protein